MRRVALVALLLAGACQRQAEAPPRPKPEPAPSHPPDTVAAPGPAAEPSQETDDGADAAGVLRRYYGLIEVRRYDDAWKMRSGGRGIDPAEFADHFKAYERYHSDVGVPSRPVASGGWLYVEVPVMTTGRFLGGKPFGSSGSVTLRRPGPGTNAPAGEHGWHIYTG